MPRETMPKAAVIHPCPGCGEMVACGMANGQDTCWCVSVPPALPVPASDSAARCYCRRCLEKLAGVSRDFRE